MIMRAGPNSAVGEVSRRERFDNETLSRPRDNTGTDPGDRQNLQGCPSRGMPSETAQLPASGTPAQRLGLQPAGSCPCWVPSSSLRRAGASTVHRPSGPRPCPRCPLRPARVPVERWASRQLRQGTRAGFYLCGRATCLARGS